MKIIIQHRQIERSFKFMDGPLDKLFMRGEGRGGGSEFLSLIFLMSIKVITAMNIIVFNYINIKLHVYVHFLYSTGKKCNSQNGFNLVFCWKYRIQQIGFKFISSPPNAYLFILFVCFQHQTPQKKSYHIRPQKERIYQGCQYDFRYNSGNIRLNFKQILNKLPGEYIYHKSIKQLTQTTESLSQIDDQLKAPGQLLLQV